MSTFSRRIVCALTIALLTTGLTGGTYAIAATPDRGAQGVLEPDPDFEKPPVGKCRNYGMAAVFEESNDSQTVSCGTTHTSKVVGTPLLPDSLTWDSTDNAIQLAVLKGCLPAFRHYLGRTEALRHRSAYEFAWFEPTQTQKDAGARWIRCDLVLIGGLSLMPIKRNAIPILQAAPLPRSVTSCLAGSDPIRKTVCTKTHRYRATGTYLVDRSTYPGEDGMRTIANRRCPSRVSTPRSWYATWPRKNSWLAGNHTITCYSRTSN
jgi:hypothetical protein